MRLSVRPLFSVFVRYVVRFMLPPAKRRKVARVEAHAAHANPTYPAGTARPIALDSLTTLL